MKTTRQLERGQAAVLMAFGMIVMLGFVALAIDGGMVYTERRHEQNAADSAALAGALQKANAQPDSVVLQAAHDNTTANNYTGGQVFSEVTGPFTDYFGEYWLVTVKITSTVETAFAHLVFGGQLQSTVTAVARAMVSQPPMAGFAIVTLAPTCSHGSPLVSQTGGGNSGGVVTHNGGIWINAVETASAPCAIAPPTSNHNDGITVMDGHQIVSVGVYSYTNGLINGEENISPTPIQTRANGGAPIDDPLAELPEPTCSNAGTKENFHTGDIYHPGNWNGAALGAGHYTPGIYCITGDIKLTGNSSQVIEGTGVLFFLKTGGIDLGGSGALNISAPDGGNCLGQEGLSTSSCTYRGIGLYSAHGNTSSLDLRGNGGAPVVGTVYAPDGAVRARGGGSNPDETDITGQVIARTVENCGGGSLNVTYNDNVVYHLAPRLRLEQ